MDNKRNKITNAALQRQQISADKAMDIYKKNKNNIFDINTQKQIEEDKKFALQLQQNNTSVRSSSSSSSNKAIYRQKQIEEDERLALQLQNIEFED